MPWTDTQWAGFCALLREGWPGDFDEAAQDAWRLLLSDVEPQEAVAGLRVLVAKGSRFRPSVGELVAEIRSDPTRPTFDEALAQLVRAIQVRPDAAVLERGAEWMHPYAHAFLKSFGVDRFRRLEIYDDDYGDLRMTELRDAWQRFETRAESRERSGLELAPGRSGQLKRLAPHETLRQLAPPDRTDHLRPAE